MPYRSIKGYTGFGQLGLLLVFLGLGFILAGGAQLIIAMKIVPEGTPFANLGDAMLKAMLDPANVSYARLAQVLGTFFLLFIPAVLFSWISNGKNTWWLGFNKYVNIYQVLLGFLIIFTANILAAPLADMSKALISHLPSLDKMAKSLEEAYNEQVLVLSNLKSWPELIMALAIMAFFPAMFEEMFFRGAIAKPADQMVEDAGTGYNCNFTFIQSDSSFSISFPEQGFIGFCIGDDVLQNQKYLGKHHCAFSQ
jgi:membrane protease YdiL (CAAX protease family)